MAGADTTRSNYEIDLRKDYIYLKFNGSIQIDDLRSSTDGILQLAEKENVHNLLDDIRQLNRTSVTIHLQTEAISLLWRLKSFKKIALLYSDDEIGGLVRSTLELIHFLPKCRAFNNEPDAITWLQEE